jgi:ABC-type antimicrobial peptide transport system permease subunit
MTSVRRDNFRLAYRSLRAAKARSFLTMLGIIIGVTAVILMVSIGQGVKQQISGQLGRHSKDVVLVQPNAGTSSGSLLSGLAASNSGLLTENDLRTVQKADGVASAVPLATVSGKATGDHTVPAPFVIATTADFPKVIGQSYASGGFFDPEVDSKTVVLGNTIAQKLFDDNAPLGQTLTWRGESFVVAGVFNDFHAPPFSLEGGFNNAVFVPYSSAQKLSGSVLGIYQILVKPDSTSASGKAITNIDRSLTAEHGGSHDVVVARASDTNLTSDQTIHLLTLLVTGGAIIALIVGGVGIMDVMLVSVTERMHEIGIRKAIGATNRQILRQFMAEAFVLSGMGALIGVVLSLAAIGLLRLYSSLQPVIVWQILIIAPVIAIAIGLFFGGMPALKAARKDPIEALRHE